MDEEREVQGQVHRGLLNHREDAVSLCSRVRLGVESLWLPPSYMTGARYGRASGVLTRDLGEEYQPCKVVKIK